MNETFNKLTSRFIDDFTTAKKVYKLDGYYAASSYAASLLGSDVKIDEDRLKEAKKLISRHSSGFVNIKSTLAKEVAAAAVAESSLTSFTTHSERFAPAQISSEFRHQ